MFSYIQQLILTKLLGAQNGLRYSEAAPIDVDDNLYHYHLNFLIKKGIVVYENGIYQLTERGKVEVQKIDSEGRTKEFFKVGVLPYVTRTNSEQREILLEKRLRHPYFGDINPSVAGRIQIGETIESCAKARLEEKTGLIAEFKLIGVIRKIRRNLEGKVLEDCFYHACYGENPSGELDQENVYGNHFWDTFENAIEYQKKNITASKLSEEIIKRIMNKDYSQFYFQEDLKLTI